MPLKMCLLDFLDRHVPRQLQHVTGEGMRVTSPRFYERDLYLTHAAASTTAHPRHGKLNPDLLSSHGDMPIAPLGLATQYHVWTSATRATQFFARLLEVDNHFPLQVLLLHVPIATDSKSVI